MNQYKSGNFLKPFVKYRKTKRRRRAKRTSRGRKARRIRRRGRRSRRSRRSRRFGGALRRRRRTRKQRGGRLVMDQRVILTTEGIKQIRGATNKWQGKVTGMWETTPKYFESVPPQKLHIHNPRSAVFTRKSARKFIAGVDPMVYGVQWKFPKPAFAGPTADRIWSKEQLFTAQRDLHIPDQIFDLDLIKNDPQTRDGEDFWS